MVAAMRSIQEALGIKSPRPSALHDVVEFNSMVDRIRVDPRVLRVVAAGANEPVQRKGFEDAQLGDNRRVEIVVRESMMDDYRAGETGSARDGLKPTSTGSFKSAE